MTNNIKRLSRGFTIIEVMIVLVIAGLILVIVFLAIPQLQRTQRDNARQSAVVRLKSEMETYASNNQGLYPFGPGFSVDCSGGSYTVGNWNDFYCRYIDGEVDLQDPTGVPIITSNPNPGDCNDVDGCVRGYGTFGLPSSAGRTAVIYRAKFIRTNI